jgi:hypothetical protein
MEKNTERILVVHSVTGTEPSEIAIVEEAIRSFERLDSSVRAVPVVFAIPAGAAPGSTLATELHEELRSCIGALVFVDDLRPNVAYELGFFHGRGRTVLLLTHQSVDSTWLAISDLAGAAVVKVDGASLASAVPSYLNRLYDELSSTTAWPASQLPSAEHNLLGQIPLPHKFGGEFLEGGNWGAFLKLNAWDGITINCGFNLLPGAGFKVVLRALQHAADYSVYFRARFADRSGKRREAWLGLTSRRMVSGLQSDERTLPSQPLTLSWHILNGRFQELIELGSLNASGPAYYLEQIRIRADDLSKQRLARLR